MRSATIGSDAVVVELRPPPPRVRPDLDTVCAALQAAPPPVGWDTVSVPGLAGAWVGMCPVFGPNEGVNPAHVRPLHPLSGGWLWDVVEPPDSRLDPLVLSVAQDMVEIRVFDGSRRSFEVTVSVRHVPDVLEIQQSALPPPPWTVEWSTGWSRTALHAAAQGWLDALGVAAKLQSPTVPDLAVYDLGSQLCCTGPAFDALLTLPPNDASAMTRLFSAALEDLDRHGLL